MEDNQIVDFLKSKYISKPSTNTSNSNTIESKDEVVGDDTEMDMDKIENKFLVSKLSNIQVELTKWLDILKSKL